MTNFLVSDFILILMIFLRIIAVFISAPFFGHKALPVIVKIFMAFFIALIVFMTIDKTKMAVSPDLYWLFITAFKEILTGLLFGFMINMVFYGISYAGSLIGFDIGLSMAEVFDPSQEVETNVIGEILYIGAILIFVLINGHHYIIRGIVSSFDLVRIGDFAITKPVFDLIVSYSGGVFVIAVKIASPIMVSFFLVHLAEGIISRVIPQMQIFFVTQPLKLALGFFLLSSLVPVYIVIIKNLLHSYEDALYNLIKTMGT